MVGGIRIETFLRASPEVPPPPPKLKRARAEKPVKQDRLPPPEKAIKTKSIIKRQQPPPAVQEWAPSQMNVYEAMLLQRQHQARMHQERMLAPCAQMFSHRQQ